jgi:hypothetical protein
MPEEPCFYHRKRSMRKNPICAQDPYFPSEQTEQAYEDAGYRPLWRLRQANPKALS